MSIFATLDAKKALMKLQKGDVEAAKALFAKAEEGGLKDARNLLTYSVLLIRGGEYQKARDLLVKIQNYPMQPESRRQLYVNYASVIYKMGEIEKAVELLERQHAKAPCGMIYQTLGYLYVEAGNFEKAVAYNQEALEYDDEDPIVLDNLGQAYYRLGNDKETAKTYFDKAIEAKPSQIDTLYFLSQYDLEAGNKEAAREKLQKASEGRFSPLNYATREMVAKALEDLKA